VVGRDAMLDVSGFEFQTPNEERNSTGMAVLQKFEDIKAWQKSRELTRQTYDVSNRDKFFKDFGLRDQIRRAGISVMFNIAEGLNEVEQLNLYSFLRWQKARLVKLCHNSTSPEIRSTLQAINSTDYQNCQGHCSNDFGLDELFTQVGHQRNKI